MIPSGELAITAGRHPVVEQMLKEGEFVPNDVRLDDNEQQVLIITGPNMAGKSTILRQVALICLLAQAGSFVPAEAAQLAPAWTASSPGWGPWTTWPEGAPPSWWR